jgi:hypothetical protein
LRNLAAAGAGIRRCHAETQGGDSDEGCGHSSDQVRSMTRAMSNRFHDGSFSAG